MILRVGASLLAGVVCLSTVARVGAAAPSIIMIYGGPLQVPILMRHEVTSDLPRLASFWCGSGRSARQPTPALEGRPHLKVAMFWGIDIWSDPSAFDRLAPTLRPENAHQHGRLYLPASGEPAVMVSTDYMRVNTSIRPPAPVVRPVPSDLGDFEFKCLPDAQTLALARSLGVPGL